MSVEPVAKKHSKVRLPHQRGKDPVRNVLIGAIGSHVLQRNVRILLKEFPATAIGQAGSGCRPVMLSRPIPVIPGIKTEHHVVTKICDIDPALRLRIIIEARFETAPGHAPVIPATVVATGRRAAGKMKILTRPGIVTGHEILIRMFMDVINAMVGSVEEKVYLAPTLSGLSHGQLHLVNPRISRQLRISAAGHRRAPVGHRRILLRTQPVECVVRMTSQTQFVELRRRPGRKSRSPGKYGIAQLGRSILSPKSCRHTQFWRTQTRRSGRRHTAINLEAWLAILRIEQLDRRQPLGRRGPSAHNYRNRGQCQKGIVEQWPVSRMLRNTR